MFELSHGLALVPLIGMALWWRKLPQPVKSRYWFLAVAFFMSGVGDTLVKALGDGWGTTQRVWVPFQIGLALWAYIEDATHRAVVFFGLLGATVLSLQIPGPDIILTVGGSMLVMKVAKGRSMFPVWIYFWFGTIAYVFMALHATPGDAMFGPAWTAYQICRLTAYATFVIVLFAKTREAA